MDSNHHCSIHVDVNSVLEHLCTHDDGRVTVTVKSAEFDPIRIHLTGTRAEMRFFGARLNSMFREQENVDELQVL